MRNLVPLVWVLVIGNLISCSPKADEEGLAQLPIYQTSNFRFSPGEKLHYQVNLGMLKVGHLDLEVGTDCDTTFGKIAIPIVATARTRSGVKWLTQIEHKWHSWIDTASGNTLKMNRYARENKYVSNEVVDFETDLASVLQFDPDEPAKTTKTLKQHRQSTDLVNLIWKMRYTDFARIPPDDTTNYSAYFDKRWYYFRIRNQGSTLYKWKGKKHKVYELIPLGTATRFLKGEEPATIFLEEGNARRILAIRLSTYFGTVSLELT